MVVAGMGLLSVVIDDVVHTKITFQRQLEFVKPDPESVTVILKAYVAGTMLTSVVTTNFLFVWSSENADGIVPPACSASTYDSTGVPGHAGLDV